MLEPQGIRVWSLGWEIACRRKWQPTPVFLPEKSQGQKSPVDYSSITASDEIERGSKITGLVFPGGSVVKYPACQYRSCCCLVTESCPTLCSPWTVAHQTLPFTECPRQENWSGLPFPSLGDLPNPGIKPEFSCIGRQILYCLRGATG